ncbi:MAG: hypothetical protein ACE5GE_05690 [Phycisphaerae bacterium]
MSRVIGYELPEYLAQRRSASRTDRVVQVVAVALAGLAVGGASFFVAPMNQLRKEKYMLVDPDSIKGLPPVERLLAQTATFRALAIDIAFIRCESLKEEGKYYEIMQLANWICAMAPRFPSIWSFHAWNQAYNISVATYTPEQRWKWVNNGIKLLRDKGIRYNPKSVGLYKELAWIYWHKIGEFLDDQHWAYKKELAVEMEMLLGPPPPIATEQEVIDHFRGIAESPEDFERFIAEDAEVAALLARLEAVGLGPDRKLLAFVARYVRDDLSVTQYLESIDPLEEPPLQARRVALLSESESAGARERLLAGLRAKVLRDDYNMDPDWMLELMETYGPIDWRSPFGMSLYWASWGDMVTRNQLDLSRSDSMNTVRFIFFSLKSMIEKGRIVLTPDFDRPNRSQIDFLPDIRFIDHLHETMLAMTKIQFEGRPCYIEGAPSCNYRVGHINFLADAVRQLYFAGDPASREKAQHYYDYLRVVDRDYDKSPKKQYMQPLVDYVLGDVKEEVGGFKRANAYMGGFLWRSLRELALGDVERSTALFEEAKKVYQYYMKEIAAGDRLNRRKLERIPVIWRDVLIAYLQNAGVSPHHKARVWSRLDLRSRQMAWDSVLVSLTELCRRQSPPWAVEKAFPEPAGMEAYRANPIQERGRETSDVDEGERDRQN